MSLCRGTAFVLVLAVAGCEFLGLGGGDREIAWSGDLPATGTEWRGLPAVFDGQVIAEYGTGLRAWNLETGQVLWTRSLRTGVALNSRNIVVSNGRAFAAGGDSVYAVDAFTGERLWAFLPDAQAALGDIGVDDVNVYAGTRSHRVYALESGTGHLRWVVDVGATWSNFGIVMGLSSSGDTVYAAATEDLNFSGSLRRGHVVALDRSTGTELWRYITPGDQSDVGAAPVIQDRLLLGSDVYGGSFFALDRFTGQQLWRVRTKWNRPQPTSHRAGAGRVCWSQRQPGLRGGCSHWSRPLAH